MTYLVGGSSTYSKSPDHLPATWPKAVVRARNGHVYLEEGGYLVDMTGSLGAVFIGHGCPEVTEPVMSMLEAGLTNTFVPHRVEEWVAQLLCQTVGHDLVRFCKNGSDALEAAVRIARHVTGREIIITNSYHGFHSDLVAATPGRTGGVLKANYDLVHPVKTPVQMDTRLRYGDVAAVVAEPLTVEEQNWSWPDMQELCKKVGTLLVFDEVVTGFRYRFGSACPDVVPDLSCWGKAIANGYPLAALSGRRELMELVKDDVFFSSSYGGEAMSLAAAWGSLNYMRDHENCCYSYLRAGGKRILKALGPLGCGYPQRVRIQLEQPELGRFQERMLKEGVMVALDFLPMLSHTLDDIDQVVAAIKVAKQEVDGESIKDVS